VPEGFVPFGFTRDGLALYGSFGEKEIKQLAAVPLAAPLENLKVLTSLPRPSPSETLPQIKRKSCEGVSTACE
jgi:hypothetical protein